MVLAPTAAPLLCRPGFVPPSSSSRSSAVCSAASGGGVCSGGCRCCVCGCSRFARRVLSPHSRVTSAGKRSPAPNSLTKSATVSSAATAGGARQRSGGGSSSSGGGGGNDFSGLPSAVSSTGGGSAEWSARAGGVKPRAASRRLCRLSSAARLAPLRASTSARLDATRASAAALSAARPASSSSAKWRATSRRERKRAPSGER
mmetsp:Transcript_16296/g.52740  ORF Transcript_16296/g.52740 Transcript_16296/m.52740 type:complete len:203 (+) Transcript_16296:2-610(+)